MVWGKALYMASSYVLGSVAWKCGKSWISCSFQNLIVERGCQVVVVKERARKQANRQEESMHLLGHHPHCGVIVL